METKNPGFVYAYGMNRINMKVIGAWPEENENFIVTNRAWILATVIFVTIILPQTASLVFLRDDLSEFINVVNINVHVGIGIFKIILFRLRKKVLITTLSSMARDWSMPKTEKEEEVMLEKAKSSRFISILSALVASTMFLAFSSVGAWSASHRHQFMTNGTKLGVGALYSAYFPFDTNESRTFLITWFCQLFATVFSMTANSAPDSSIAMLVLHLCGQLATVRIALENIVDEKCIDDPTIYWKRLSLIIERHEELNRYGELLEESFNLMFLIQIVMCTISFCFEGFVAIGILMEGLTSENDFPFLPMIFVILLVMYTVFHLFVNCWAGNLLVQESTALTYAPYTSDWFRLPPSQARALMMVTHRARIPLQITAGKFFGLSLELFTSIMKMSMSYLSVLLAMKDD